MVSKEGKNATGGVGWEANSELYLGCVEYSVPNMGYSKQVVKNHLKSEPMLLGLDSLGVCRWEMTVKGEIVDFKRPAENELRVFVLFCF